MFKSSKHLIAALAIGMLAAPASWAATISWATIGKGGTTSTIAAPSPGANAVTMTFSSANSFNGGATDLLSWTPASTWADGVIVANAPVKANSVIFLTGGSNGLNTLKFSEAVVNPVMAIYSLGGSNVTATFVFDQTPTLVTGGPADGGGVAPVVSGNTVTGAPYWGSNGTIQFIGTFTELSWTNPQYEYWYGINVGIVNTAAAVTSPVPEPTSGALLLAGLLATGFVARRRRSA